MIWFLLGFIAYASYMSSCYERTFLIWNNLARKHFIKKALLVFLSGPFGFVNELILSKGFKSGFKIW